MRKALALVILLGTVGLASADNPHFLKADGTVNTDGELLVSFKEAGLGANVNIDYLLSTLAEPRTSASTTAATRRKASRTRLPTRR